MSERKKELLDIAVKLAAKNGVVNVTREAIAQEAGISAVAVGKHLGTTEERQKAIRKALKAAGKSEPDKKTVMAKGVELRKKGPRQVKPAKPSRTPVANAIRKVKPAAPKVQKPRAAPKAKEAPISPPPPLIDTKPKRAPRKPPAVSEATE